MIFGLCSMLGYSQTNNNDNKETKSNDKVLGKNEIKLNLPYFIAGIPEISYERIIDETSATGVSLAIAVDKPENLNVRFIVTPYYRLYFGKGRAKGFFIEGNAAVLGQKSFTVMYDYNTSTYSNANSSTTNIGFGAAIGAKFLNKNGYIGEIYTGGGRLFGVPDNYDYMQGFPRVGISIGKRF